MDIQSVPANTSRPARPLSGNASYVGDSGIILVQTCEHSVGTPQGFIASVPSDEVISRSVGIDVWLSQEDVLRLTAALLVVATAVQSTLHFCISAYLAH